MKYVLILIGIGLQFSCAVPKYAARGTDHRPYGYAETQLSDSVFRISYLGDNNTRDEVADRYALYRAAEVAIAHGAAYFTIPQEFGEKAFVARAPGGGIGDVFYAGIEHTSIKLVRISNSHPGGDTAYYDARKIAEQMSSAIELDKKLSPGGGAEPFLGVLLLLAVVAASVIVLHR